MLSDMLSFFFLLNNGGIEVVLALGWMLKSLIVEVFSPFKWGKSKWIFFKIGFASWVIK